MIAPICACSGRRQGAWTLVLLVWGVLMVHGETALAAKPMDSEISRARAWTSAHLSAKAARLPFSFVYGGVPSSELLRSCTVETSVVKMDKFRKKQVLTYTDAKTGIVVTCESVAYLDYPAVEWVVYFENKGSKDTPIIENVQALDISLTRGDSGEFVCHHAFGSNVEIRDFQPYTDTLGHNARLEFGSRHWSSKGALPFFTTACDWGGIVAAVGWSGSWSAEFARDSGKAVSITAGMNATQGPGVPTPGGKPVYTHLLLHPRERIRTPRILLMYFEGDWIRGQNVWRQLLIEHYMPRPGGKPLVGPLVDAVWGETTEADQIEKINWWGDHNLPMECFWIDANWSGKTGRPYPENAADRTPNPELYPNGMKPISDQAHKRGMKFLLWTWPNRALPHAGVGKVHPEWIINGDSFDHGNPAANQCLIEENIKLIKDQGLDFYRQDGDPIYPADSGPDRIGINQIRHFEGFYQFWDALLKEYPNLVIDNCSGGGRKQDLETISRGISLWRSDYQVPNDFDPIGMQCQTYGISDWIPWSGGCASKPDSYSMRSGYSPALVINWHVYEKVKSEGFDFDTARSLLNEYLSVRPYFNGDYYTLTSWSTSERAWMAWQFYRPDLGEGIVQAFRRQRCLADTCRVYLKGLEPGSRYSVTDIDENKPRLMYGKDLAEKGLSITIKNKPGAAVIHIRKERA